jgi:hypothetical protein
MHASYGVRSIWYDMIQDRIFYKSLEGRSIVFNTKEFVMFYSQNHNTNPPTREYLKRFAEVLSTESMCAEHSPYHPFSKEVFRSSKDGTMQLKRVFLYSQVYASKDQAIGDIIVGVYEHNNHILAGLGIPYDDFKHHYVFTCDEFDQHILQFARQQVREHQHRLSNSIMQEFRVMVETLQQQLSVLEDKIDDITQDTTISETSPQSTNNADCDDEHILTHANIVESAVIYHKSNKLSNADIVETIQMMLSDGRYTLGKDIAQNKIDFAEANTLFLAGVAPTKLNKNDLQSLLFKNVVSDDLI